MAIALIVFVVLFATLSLYHVLARILLSPLARIPGPKAFALTKWRLAYEDYKGTRTRTLLALHRQYGPVVRVGPREVSFSSTSALRSIYGAGSGFERTQIYHMFEVYGRKNMFSFASVREHAERKKMLAHAYAKSVILKGDVAVMVENKVRLYIDLLEREGRVSNIFRSLHYFSLDTITHFLYGAHGKTACLEGKALDRALLDDIINPASRRLAWFAIHLTSFTNWLYSRKGAAGHVAKYFYPMALPTAYSGIRQHAIKASHAFAVACDQLSVNHIDSNPSLIARLWKHHRSRKGERGLDELDIASECADHLDAGIDTTSDTAMFLIWALSRPSGRKFQQKLVEEIQGMPEQDINEDGIPKAEAADKLVYLNAVIRETLRLYAPLPASEPRSLPTTTAIDGYIIPARTVVSISPYVLHRNPDVFLDPLDFNPDRWLDPAANIGEMNRWFWAFSSGGRMCIGVKYALTDGMSDLPDAHAVAALQWPR